MSILIHTYMIHMSIYIRYTYIRYIYKYMNLIKLFIHLCIFRWVVCVSN